MYQYITFIAIFCIVLYFHKKYTYWRNKNIAVPKPIIPFFGNLFVSALRFKYIGKVYDDIYRAFPEEKVVGIYRMTSPALIIRDLDIVKNILINDFEVFPYRGIDFSKEGLGDNLFHCDYDTWRVLRNKLTPLFTSARLRNYTPNIVKHSNHLVNYIENIITDSTEQELRRLFEKYTMATTILFVFGLEVDTTSDDNIFATIDKHCFSTSYWVEADMLIPGIMRKVNKSLYDETINKFCYEISKTAMELQNNNYPKSNNLLNVLIDLKGKEIEDGFKITEHVISGQVFIAFVAGYGNNGSSLSYLMYYLAKYPEAQRKLINEIEKVLKKHNGELTYEALNEMSYLEQVFYEVLRLHPLTNSIQRCSVSPYTLPGSDVVIDKGISIVISPYAIHRDEKYYPNPEMFDPERFAPENSKDRHPCAFLPFGAGPRTCIGTRFAKLQFGIGVVTFLSKFRVELSENTKPIQFYDPMRSLFYPKNGIRLNIFLRNNNSLK